MNPKYISLKSQTILRNFIISLIVILFIAILCFWGILTFFSKTDDSKFESVSAILQATIGVAVSFAGAIVATIIALNARDIAMKELERNTVSDLNNMIASALTPIRDSAIKFERLFESFIEFSSDNQDFFHKMSKILFEDKNLENYMNQTFTENIKNLEKFEEINRSLKDFVDSFENIHSNYASSYIYQEIVRPIRKNKKSLLDKYKDIVYDNQNERDLSLSNTIQLTRYFKKDAVKSIFKAKNSDSLHDLMDSYLFIYLFTIKNTLKETNLSNNAIKFFVLGAFLGGSQKRVENNNIQFTSLGGLILGDLAQVFTTDASTLTQIICKMTPYISQNEISIYSHILRLININKNENCFDMSPEFTRALEEVKNTNFNYRMHLSDLQLLFKN